MTERGGRRRLFIYSTLALVFLAAGVLGLLGRAVSVPAQGGPVEALEPAPAPEKAVTSYGHVRLTSGQSVQFRMDEREWRYYYIYVPAGQVELRISLTNLSEPDKVAMWTRYGYWPTNTAYNCRSNSTCVITNPTAGYWYITLATEQVGYGCSGTLTATYRSSAGSGSESGGSSWTGGACSAVGDAGGSRASAMNVTYGRCYNASIGFSGDNDYYRFSFNGGAFNAYTTGGTDTYGYLYNYSGGLIISNDDSGSNYNFHITRTLNRGTYYLRVRNYSATGTGAYALYLGGTGYGTSSGGAAGTACASATPIVIGRVYYAYISPAGDNDYVRLNPARSGTLTVYTTGSTDTYGYLLNSACQTLTYNDDISYPSNLNFRISRRVTAGTYYVRIRGYGSTTGLYYIHTSLQ